MIVFQWQGQMNTLFYAVIKGKFIEMEPEDSNFKYFLH